MTTKPKLAWWCPKCSRAESGHVFHLAAVACPRGLATPESCRPAPAVGGGGWRIEPYGTEGYSVGRIGSPVVVTVLPETTIDMEEWGEHINAIDVTVRVTAERIRDLLNTPRAEAKP